MKLPKSVKVKDTVSLFMNKYSYKVVLVCPAASWFRGNDLDLVTLRLDEVKKNGKMPPWLKIKSPDDLKNCFDVCKALKGFSDYQIRIEHPLINFYTNNESSVEKLSALDPDRVKYVSRPNKSNPTLTEGTVIVKNLDFDFKIYLGRTRKSHLEFVEWAKNNKKIRLTKRVIEDLSRSSSWGGGYFYVKGESNLTMVKMFVGTEISKIEAVIKA